MVYCSGEQNRPLNLLSPDSLYRKAPGRMCHAFLINLSSAADLAVLFNFCYQQEFLWVQD